MKLLKLLITIVLFCPYMQAQDSVKISGYARDFDGRPLDSVVVHLKDKNFNDLYSTYSNKNGYYELKISASNYYCIYAIKESEYGKSRLEFWAWNIPAYKDLNINPSYNRLEVYVVNIFEPQVSLHETYMVYFRPMSLTRVLPLKDKDLKTYDIAPDSLSEKDIDIKMNGTSTKIVSISKVSEYARGKILSGYLVQFKKSNTENPELKEYNKIEITVTDPGNGDKGKSISYIKK